MTTNLEYDVCIIGSGAGGGPVAMVLAEAGFSMAVYDYFYANDRKPLAKQYDFICASEVVEHLRDPGRDLNMLWSLLKPEGYLGIMTKQVIDKKSFGSWHYIQDPTHVCFFSPAVFQWLADHWQAELEIIGKDVVLFRKRNQ